MTDDLEYRDGWLWPAADRDTWPAVRGELAEIPTILGYCRERRVCIQAGGNGGLWVKPLGEAFERVYSFEPDPLMFRCLVANVTAPNVVKTQAALGGHYGFIGIDRWCGKRNPGANRIALEKGFIPLTTIDGYGFEDVDLIQLDIEGAELMALKGAAETIDLCKPVIVLELRNHATHYGATDRQIRDWVIGRGYRLAERINEDEIFVPS